VEWLNRIICGDALEMLEQMPSDYVDCILTSPPYWGLRDFQLGKEQLGLEPTLELYLDHLFAVTQELRRVLKPTGVLWWNHGDCYGDKCLVLQNYRLILRMVDEGGWILRNAVVWHKPNAMPSSVKDRFSNAYEPVFMLTKSKKYWFDLDAVREQGKEWGARKPRKSRDKTDMDLGQKWNEQREYSGTNPAGKNPGDVWRISTCPFSDTHFATFPPALAEWCIKAACPLQICPQCGEARRRIVEPTSTYAKELGESWHNHKADMEVGQRKGTTIGKRFTAQYVTTGWTSCSCNVGWEAGIVLDPFMGSGTVGMVAKQLGRNYIGIELNPSYVEMAEQRIAKVHRQEELGV